MASAKKDLSLKKQARILQIISTINNAVHIAAIDVEIICWTGKIAHSCFISIRSAGEKKSKKENLSRLFIYLCGLFFSSSSSSVK